MTCNISARCSGSSNGIRPQARDGGGDRGQRGSQLMRDGVQQRIAQALALAGGFEARQRFDCAGALNGDGRESADGIERFRRGARAGDADGTDGPRSQQDRDQGDVARFVAVMIAREGCVAQLGGGHVHVVRGWSGRRDPSRADRRLRRPG